MRTYALRTDLDRATIDGFSLPLGLAPGGQFAVPKQGYTVTYTAAEDEEPDTYAFHVVASHERLKPLLDTAFSLLPDRVFGIIEIGSRDAYRSVDVFIGRAAIDRDHFMDVWDEFETFLLEDGTMAAGANSDDPYVEIFVDQMKSVSIHVPLAMRDRVEAMLHEQGLEEVPETWMLDETGAIVGETEVRTVLDLHDEYSPDVDELLLQLRHEWNLELNIDPEQNIDEGGRRLGLTLWHAVVIVDPTDEEDDTGAYASIWATAGSLAEMEQLIVGALLSHEQWTISEVYTIDRVAFDERPDELGDLPPRRTQQAVHLVQVDPWGAVPGDRDDP